MIKLNLRVEVIGLDTENNALLEKPALSMSETQRLMKWSYHTLKDKLDSGEIDSFTEGTRVKVVTASLLAYIKRKVTEQIQTRGIKVA